MRSINTSLAITLRIQLISVGWNLQTKNFTKKLEELKLFSGVFIVLMCVVLLPTWMESIESPLDGALMFLVAAVGIFVGVFEPQLFRYAVRCLVDRKLLFAYYYLTLLVCPATENFVFKF